MSTSKNKPKQGGLSEKHWGEIQAILRKYPDIQTATLFGSRSKGTHKAGSDIDIALEGKNLDSMLMIRIQSDFEESTLPYFFDLLNLKNTHSPELLEHIKTHGIDINLS